MIPADTPDPVVFLEGNWDIVFRDEFDNAEQTEANWQFQNGPSGHILSSRWRDNAVFEDGLLKLCARKESRAGQDWTAASIHTHRRFQYGYFECRYRYLPATGTNNSFWLHTLDTVSSDESFRKDEKAAAPIAPQKFEIDINEGHHPNDLVMGYHNWTGEHWKKGETWKYDPDGQSNLGESFHIYSLLWNSVSFFHYFDGREVLRQRHEICRRPVHVFLSLAIIDWAGPVTDAIDGRSMDVDYVRIWQTDEGTIPHPPSP